MSSLTEGRAVHLILFLLTWVTTTLAIGVMHFDPGLPWGEALSVSLKAGGMYSATLMSILLAHEMGHYLAARRHEISVTLPYFIPGPPFLSLGTFGAFIKIRQRIDHRDALLDVAMSGPLAGMVVAIPAVILGLSLSPVEPLDPSRVYLTEGNSLLYLALKWLVVGPIPEGHDVMLHPVAFAGWMGFLVTSLNLFPIGQLDGGHLAYGLLGPSRGRYVARATFGALLGLAIGMALFEHQFVWVVWVALVWFLGIEHPPIVDHPERPVGLARRILGYLALALFVLTFTPVPMSESAPAEEGPHAVSQMSGMRSPGSAQADAGSGAGRAEPHGPGLSQLRRAPAPDRDQGSSDVEGAGGGPGTLGQGPREL